MSYPTNLLQYGFDSKVVEPVGSGSYGVTLIGEAPGSVESATGIPFHPEAPAGGTLDRILRRAGLQRDGFRITNTVWQRPPANYLDGSRYEAEAIETWRPFLEAEIERTRPKVIVALGNTALKALTAFGGKGAGITNVRGYVLHSRYDAWVVGTYHPSYILQGQQALSPVVIYDISRAVAYAREGFAREPRAYRTAPTAAEFAAWADGFDSARHVLSYDIETPESGKLDEEQVEEEDISYTIIRASFCYTSGQAISIPWQEPFITIAKRLLARATQRRTWNGRHFDDPRLRAAGCTFQGVHYDCMWGWHHLQPTLPRGLGFVTPFYGWTGEPWKHLNDAQPEWYSCCDADALHENGEGIERNLKQLGLWDNYLKHVVETQDVLELMSRNGLPYSQDKAKAFELELQAKYDERAAELQRRVPDSLKPSKQKQGLKKEPKDTAGLTQRKFWVLDAETNTPVEVERWCKLEPFLPTSSQQVLALIKHFKHKAGTNRKTKKATSDEDTLTKLWRKYRLARNEHDREAAELYYMIVECRQLNKVLGTYIRGWRPGRDGRIHPTFGFWGDMFRINARRPNTAATIVDKREQQIAAGFRKCVATENGRLLIEADWKGAEAVLTGWFANDPDYMRLGRLGVHAFMSALTLYDTKKTTTVPELSWSDDDLIAYFKELKKRFPFEYDQNKHGVHLSNYCGTPFLMNEMFPESFPTKGAAAKWQDFYFSTVASKVRAWQKSVLQRAHQEAFLVNPFGYRMPFWDVLKWDAKKKDWGLGTEAKSAVSFLPRDTLAGMLKDAILTLRPLAEEGVLLAPTHDSLLSEAEEPRVDVVATRVRDIMETPVSVLGGLVIGTEIAVGPCWDKASMETWVPYETLVARPPAPSYDVLRTEVS